MVELVQQLEPACQQAGHVFVASVSRLLERLLGTSMNSTAGIPPAKFSRQISIINIVGKGHSEITVYPFLKVLSSEMD
jgi:hypothetical protein